MLDSASFLICYANLQIRYLCLAQAEITDLEVGIAIRRIVTC